MKAIIKEPCDKKWNELHPNDRGAFCNACSKTVVDFTEKSNEEIVEYLRTSSEKNVCGRISIPKPIPWFRWKYIAAILAPFIWACNGFGQNNTTLGEMACDPHPTDTSKSSDTLKCHPKMGKMAVTPHSIPMVDTPKVEKPETIELLGDVDIMGMMLIEEPEVPKKTEDSDKSKDLKKEDDIE